MSKLVPKTFKIEKRHKVRIESRPYSKAPGELIRILLDEFFDGKLPSVNIRFNKVIADRKRDEKDGKRKTVGATIIAGSRPISNCVPNLQGTESNS